MRGRTHSTPATSGRMPIVTARRSPGGLAIQKSRGEYCGSSVPCPNAIDTAISVATGSGASNNAHPGRDLKVAGTGPRRTAAASGPRPVVQGHTRGSAAGRRPAGTAGFGEAGEWCGPLGRTEVCPPSTGYEVARGCREPTECRPGHCGSTLPRGLLQIVLRAARAPLEYSDSDDEGPRAAATHRRRIGGPGNRNCTTRSRSRLPASMPRASAQ